MNNRRSFLRKLLLSLPAGYVLPSVLSSCETQDDLFPNLSFGGKVIVVGAGAAGLHAAYILHKNGVDVQVLEATNRVGGRIKALDEFTGYPLELGADHVQGTNSVFYDAVRISNFEYYQDRGKTYYQLTGKTIEESEASSNTAFRAASKVIEKLPLYSGPDISLSEYLNKEPLSDETLTLLNSFIANEFGTDLDLLSVAGYNEAVAKRTSGNEKIILRRRSFSEVLDLQYSPISSKIRQNTPIKSIDYGSGKVVLTDDANQTYEADKVIVTVPLSILKEGRISFNPALPEEKVLAMDGLGMDGSVKIFMRFGQNFWGDETSTVYPGGIIPEYKAPGWGKRSEFDDDLIFFNNVLVGEANGSAGTTLSELGNDAVTYALRDLDDMFNGQATKYLTQSYVMDWSKDTFTRGAYSYPKVGSEGARGVLASAIDNKIYFAGEATHNEGHFGTVHGAMETGYRAAYEILKSIS
jgi:monoamine oxidase